VTGALTRATVRAWLEEASGQAIPVEDPTPDELIAAAEALCASLESVKLWMHDTPAHWTAADFARWFLRPGDPWLAQLPTHCYSCGAYLMGGATQHAADCGIRRIIDEAFEVKQ
jgi:hypothetical protein